MGINLKIIKNKKNNQMSVCLPRKLLNFKKGNIEPKIIKIKKMEWGY